MECFLWRRRKAWVALVGKTGSWDVISGAGVRMDAGAKSWVWRQSQALAPGIKEFVSEAWPLRWAVSAPRAQ